MRWNAASTSRYPRAASRSPRSPDSDPARRPSNQPSPTSLSTCWPAGVRAAFDPTVADRGGPHPGPRSVGGLDPVRPLAPLEACVGLDRPVWRDVDGAFPEWLLPGLSAMPADAVIALETNPIFVAALLVGFNTQLLGELRWRNIPVSDRMHTAPQFLAAVRRHDG